MRKRCILCGKDKEPERLNRSLCFDCYYTKHVLRQPRPDLICPKCQKIVHYFVNGLCRSCNIANYNLAHRQEITDKERERRHKNIDRYRAVDRKRNETPARKEWKKAYQDVYYEKNKVYLQAYNREWMKSHKEQMGHYHAIRNTRKKQLPATLTPQEWQEILITHGNKCFYCGISGVTLHKEHKIPISRGGGFVKENIVPACGSCNSQKSFRTPEEFAEYLKEKKG
jgi:5-methylcytosine-specific restriction endonuclease McrA